MNNIYILPTDKPSRLYTVDSIGKLDWSEGYLHQVDGATNQNIYITNDEEIKEGDWCLDKFNQRWKLEDERLIAFDSKGIKRFSTDNILGHDCKKIILTTDQSLDGVQAIDDEFLEWFVKNQSCEKAEVEGNIYKGQDETEYKIIIPKEERERGITITHVGKQETFEEVAERFVKNRFTKQICNDESYPDIYASKEAIVESHILFAKCQQEISYSEEELLNLLTHFAVEIQRQNKKGQYPIEIKGWFERNKDKFKNR